MIDDITTEHNTSDADEVKRPAPEIPADYQHTLFIQPWAGVLVVEQSYADMGDLGQEDGGNVGLGQVIATAQDARLTTLPGGLIAFRASAGERWQYRGLWYRFLPDATDILGVVADVENDRRVATVQAFQQGESARELFYAPNGSTYDGRLTPQS